MGWDDTKVDLMVVHMSAQSVLYSLEDKNGHVKFFCTFIYALNKGVDRRVLWEELEVDKSITDGHPWPLMGVLMSS